MNVFMGPSPLVGLPLYRLNRPESFGALEAYKFSPFSSPGPWNCHAFHALSTALQNYRPFKTVAQG